MPDMPAPEITPDDHVHVSSADTAKDDQDTRKSTYTPDHHHDHHDHPPVLEYILPKVEPFANLLSTRPNRRPEFNLYEKLGDTIWSFATYYYLGEFLPLGTPDRMIPQMAFYLQNSVAQTTILNYTGMEGTINMSITKQLERVGRDVEPQADYFECYLGMLYHLQGPEVCMTTVKKLVQVGSKYVNLSTSEPSNTSTPKAGLSNFDASSSQPPPSSQPADPSIPLTATADPSTAAPSPTDPTTPKPSNSDPSLISTSQKQKRKKPPKPKLPSHTTAEHFILFACTSSIFQKLITQPVIHPLFTAFLHYLSTRMYKTIFPAFTAQIDTKFTTPKKIRNEHITKLLANSHSPCDAVVEYLSYDQIKEMMTTIDSIIVNINRLHENGAEFKSEEGGEVSSVAFRRDSGELLNPVKNFQKTVELYKWLASTDEVDKVIASRPRDRIRKAPDNVDKKDTTRGRKRRRRNKKAGRQ